MSEPPDDDPLAPTVVPSPPAGSPAARSASEERELAVGATIAGAAVPPKKSLPPLVVNTLATLAGPPAQRREPDLVPESAITQVRRVGEELHEATLERLDEVPRSRYELLGELARGGLGRIVRARDPRTGRIVALKEVLRPTNDIILRFVREAIVTANLQHPSIVPVYEVGKWPNGEPFYAMKLVEGRTLEVLINQGKTLGARLALLPHLVAVAEAIAYAHAERVIHRDLKPGNVLVGSYGETVVIDWGLARNLETGEENGELPAARGGGYAMLPSQPPGPIATAAATSRPRSASQSNASAMTIAGAIVGTPAYMSPEQAMGHVLDERSDVYAIGVIAYHLIGGRRPFTDARTVDELIDMVATKSPRPILELAPEAPRELVAVVERAMARDPADRYPTAKGLAADLQRFISGQLVGAHSYSAWELLRRWVGKHRAIVATVAAALVALGAVGAVSVRKISRERDEANSQRALAQRERTRAEQNFGASLEELGRQELVAGAPGRALPLLVESARVKPAISPALALLLGQARDAYTGLVAIAPPNAESAIEGDLGRGTATYTVDTSRALVAWDTTSGSSLWTTAKTRTVRISPDGTWALTVEDADSLVLRDATTGVERARWTIADARPEDAIVLAWGPASDRFAIGAKGGTLLLGGPASKSLVTVTEGAEQYWSVEFSPSGDRVVGCGDAGVAVVLDAVTGAIQQRLVDPTVTGAHALASCVWADETHVYSGGADKIARLWDVTARAVTQRLACPDEITVILAVRDAVAVLGVGPIATLWDPSSGRKRADLDGHRQASDWGAIVNGALVTADEGGGVFVWDRITGARVQTLPSEGGISYLVAHDHRLLGFGYGRARIWQIDQDATLQRIDAHTARVRSLTFDEHDLLWTTSNDGTAAVIDPTGARATRRFGTGGWSETTVVDPYSDAAKQPPNPHGMRVVAHDHGATIIATGTEDGTITLYDATTGVERTHWVAHQGRVRGIVFTTDARTMFSVGDTTLRRWDVVTGRELGKVELGAGAWDVRFVGDEALLAVQTNQPDQVQLYRAVDLTAASKPSIDTLRDLVVDGDRIIGATRETLYALDRTGVVVQHVPVTSAFDVAVATEPDGKRVIASVDSHGDLSVFDAAKLTPLRSWRAFDALVTVLAFRADGAIVAAASGDSVRVWDVHTGRLLASLPHVGLLVTQLAFSRDGNHLAIAGGSGAYFLWNLTPMAMPELATIAAFATCVSPWRIDGSSLALAPRAFDPRSCAMLSAAPRSR